jgi:hypothetical protein
MIFLNSAAACVSSIRFAVQEYLLRCLAPKLFLFSSSHVQKLNIRCGSNLAPPANESSPEQNSRADNFSDGAPIRQALKDTPVIFDSIVSGRN